MKSKLVLAIGAILALVIAVGCSNDSRTTAPASVDNVFNLPNDDAVSRFDSDVSVNQPAPIGGDPVVTMVGIYHRTERGCQSIAVSGNSEGVPAEYIELNFISLGAPLIDSGSRILVKGTYHGHPGGYCMLPTSIEVEEFQVLSQPRADQDENLSAF